MNHRNRRFVRKGLVALALLVLAAWLVPSFVNADRYRRRLEAGLEQALKRPVAFGAVSFHLLPRPGFAIDNVLVREDPRFGAEPFAHVDRIDGDLRWRSLMRSRLEFSRLHLDHPTLNVVRNLQGEWNIESLLRESGIAAPKAPGPRMRPPPGLDLDVDSARLDFKIGDDKKPFAITDLRARLNFDPARGLLRYRLTGTPVRTDLSVPSLSLLTPGDMDFEGDWTPGRNLDGPINATLVARKSLLYDWVPLVTGRNPGIYGVIDLTVNFTGTVSALTAEGDGEISQLYRWELPPPSDSTRLRIHFRGEMDRPEGRVVVESADVDFGDAHLHAAGSVASVFTAPDLSLVLAMGGSSLEDVFALGRRFWAGPNWLDGSGAVNGILAVRGPSTQRRYGGLLTARQVRLGVPSGKVAVSETVLLIDNQGVRLAPVRVTVGPHLELAAEGTAGYLMPSSKAAGAARYELTLTAKSLGLGDLVRFARSAGVRAIQGIEARNGTVSGVFHLEGSAWPPKLPTVDGRVDVESARLLLPGLSEPLDVPRAVVNVARDQVVAYPITASIGGSTFTGRLEHSGEAKTPWKFDLGTDRLSLDQAALWFEALGHRTAPPSILDLLPGLRSFDTRRAAASNLFGAINAKGLFHALEISYRSLTLENPQATVEIAGRAVRVTGASFRAAGGRGHAVLEVDTSAQPARVTGSVALEEAGLQALTPWLPASLGKLRGLVSGSSRFETRGLTRQEVAGHLEAEASLELKDVSFGDFDPLGALVERCHLGTLEPSRRRAAVRSAAVTLKVRDRRVMLTTGPVDLAGARLELVGSYSFEGKLDLAIRTDLRHLARQWQAMAASPASESVGVAAARQPVGSFGEGQGAPSSAAEARDRLVANVHLAGPLGKLEVVPGAPAARSGAPPD